MGTIPISEEGGLEPHIMTCPRCGGLGNALTIGVLLRAPVLGAEAGTYAYYNRGKRKETEDAVEKAGFGLGKAEHVPVDQVQVPILDSEPCAKCKEEIAEHRKLVSEGGIHWKCDCGAQGILKADAVNRMFNSMMVNRLNAHRDKDGQVGMEAVKCPKCAGENLIEWKR